MRFDDTVITISRQYGSGGRLIGQKLAENLGIPFYDQNIITMAAEQTGMSEEFLKNTEEKANHALRFSLSYLGNLSYTMPLNDKVFIAQSAVIREVSEKGPCVIVGRCADYILKENPHSLHIFIYADMPARIKLASEQYDFPEQKTFEKTAEVLSKIDKQRETYYNYYTDQLWGKADNYHLCINSSLLGIEGTAKVLEKFVKQFEESMQK